MPLCHLSRSRAPCSVLGRRRRWRRRWRRSRSAGTAWSTGGAWCGCRRAAGPCPAPGASPSRAGAAAGPACAPGARWTPSPPGWSPAVPCTPRSTRLQTRGRGRVAGGQGECGGVVSLKPKCPQRTGNMLYHNPVYLSGCTWRHCVERHTIRPEEHFEVSLKWKRLWCILIKYT